LKNLGKIFQKKWPKDLEGKREVRNFALAKRN
jgi:hypothetical protein